MFKLTKYIILLLWAVTYYAKCQDSDSNKLSSYEGLHFLVGFMENESHIAEPYKLLEQKIFVSSNFNTTIKVSLGFSFPIEYKITQNDVLTIDVPREFENYDSEVPKNNLVEIKSEFPVSVYAYSSIPRSSDSYAVIPVANWGNEYAAVSLPNDQYNKITLDSVKDYTPRSSQFMIMAAYDDTKVTIIPTSLTRKVKQVGQSYQVTLMKGQSYLVQSWQYARGMGDLSGSIVRSDKPVGMLTGHVRSALMQGFIEQPPDSKDHLIEMLMPTSAWGNTFVSIPFGTNKFKGDYFKVNCLDVNAVIDIETKNGKQQIKFNGSTVQTLPGLAEPALWRCSAPVQLSQFMYRTGDTSETVYYDPSLVVLPPVEQFVNKIAFNTPDESFVYADGVKFTDHFVTIVAQPQALSNLKLDNVLVSSISQIDQQNIPGTNLKWARISLSSGKHNLVATEGRFAGILFGVGRFDSYAMTLGCSLQNPFKEDSHPPTITVVEECGKLQGNITDEVSDESFGIYYAWVQQDSTNNYKWVIDPIESDARFITFTAEPIDKYKDGIFIIDYLDKNGNKARYIHNYDAIKLDYKSEIILPQIDYNDSLCIEIPIRNLGKKSIEFLKSVLTSDSRITLKNITNLNSVIKSGDSALILLCINPKGNSEPFYGKINFEFGCDVNFEITFRGDLLALELVVEDIDFGDVQLGHTVCDSIYAVNRGNSDMLINGLKFNSQFTLDTVGLFPRLLLVGDTIFIKTCFSPDTRQKYYDSASYLNGYNLTKFSYNRGNGVAPLVKSINYDFGKVRVGASKLLSNKLENTGNQDCILNFEKFISKSHTDDNISDNLSGILNYKIIYNQSNDFDLTFTPTDTNDYKTDAAYITNWDLHPTMTISAIGKGTIPVIKTIDVNFGDVTIYSINELTPKLIESNGNEKLFIEKAYPLSGDISVFDIDYTKFSNIYIDPNNDFSNLITFIPDRVGFFEMLIAVVSDAKPNYGRDTSFIRVTGNSVQPAKYEVDITLENDILYSCRYNNAKIKLHNKGKRVQLTSLRLDKNSDDFIAELLDFVPQFIEQNETIEFNVKLFAERNKKISFKVTANFFNLDSLSTNFEIMPISGSVLLDKFDAVKYAAGDTIKIILSGKFNSDIDTLSGFFLTLDMNSEHLLIINEKIELILNNFSEKLKYNLNISKTKDKLELFVSADLIKIIKNVNWSIELTFLGLLSKETIGEWKIFASSDKCFEPAEGSIETILDSVCVFDVRHVLVDTEKSQINIYPNPASNTLRLKAILSENIFDGKIIISDNLGVNYTLSENIAVEKGISFLEYDISNFASGSYLLKFDSKILKKNILFVIIR
jgi:hypothetical protein